ncbi:hypothetical protein GV829_09450 [Sphingomonas lacunae]|uniref:DUF4393 domain-containing protein n=1 Tax=Sphingomonas lacunae TaxID=2698828 RepID=A0A6M4AU47_9SPHN|nr:hypothetical protein [Sphingomonas lacunae]QJQ32648.1 hypothetical protein GV829_09450 [Sphingomonas lacunae]
MDDDLNTNTRDYIVAVGRSAVSLVPFVGGVLGEIISVSVPRQRQDRIVEYVRMLDEKINLLEDSMQKLISEDPERIDLIESGAYSAASSTSNQRIKYIVSLVISGISSEDSNIIRRKRLLKILDEIDDDELSILIAFGQSYTGHARDAWDKIDRPMPIHMQSENDEIERNHLFDFGQERLLTLGLISMNFGSLKRGQLPEFDPKKGRFKGGLRISAMGRIFLKEVGVEQPMGS